MTAMLTCVLAGAAFASLPRMVVGDAFLKASPSRSGVTDAQFRLAMEEVMGCGGALETGRLAAVEKAVLPIWRVLPKNGQGRAEWRMMRYAAHRYFTGQMSILIRGFEPARVVNGSDVGAADIMNEKVPTLTQAVLAGAASADGFTLQDAVAMIATLERLIVDEESMLLEKVLGAANLHSETSFDRKQLEDVMELYMIHWFLGQDQESIDVLVKRPEARKKIFPHWVQIVDFAQGMVRSMAYARQQAPALAKGEMAMAGQFGFEDLHEVVGRITRTFASYWETECQTIKTSLVQLDTKGTGRITLANFYGANSDGEWRFGESEAYLRELGALDESSSWLGKQVIIPNYLQGASNCIVSTDNYLVCCVSECEAVLNDIEDAISAPVALPEEILPLVRAITTFDDEAPKLDGTLTNQLQRIAETHGGKVPLHGRLFAQWLHYVFPRECPFPHKIGTVASITPLEYGQDMLASRNDVASHASQRGTDPSSALVEAQSEAQWMTQWSEEEELHADYVDLRAPWDGRGFFAVAGLAALAAAAAVMRSSTGGKPAAAGGSFGFDAKAHFV